MAKLSTLSDNFEDGSLDTGLWNDNQGTITESGGFASIPPGGTSTGAYNFLGNSTAWDFTEDAVIFEWTFTASPNTGTEQFLQITPSVAGPGGGTQQIQIGRFETNLGFFIDDNTVEGTVSWSATNHRWIRITTTTTTLHFEGSSDGETWNDVFGGASPITLPAWDLTTVHPRFFNGFWTGSGGGNMQLRVVNPTAGVVRDFAGVAATAGSAHANLTILKAGFAGHAPTASAAFANLGVTRPLSGVAATASSAHADLTVVEFVSKDLTIDVGPTRPSKDLGATVIKETVSVSPTVVERGNPGG